MKEHRLTEGNSDILNLLSKINKFKEFSEHELNSFLKAGKLREYEANEIIIKEGVFDCWVYFLISGVLSVEKKGQQVSTLRRCADMFGEMGVIDGSPRSATIRASSKALILAFDASVIERKIKTRQIHFCYIIYRIFAEVLAVRLRNTTAEHIKIKKENQILKMKLAKLKLSPLTKGTTPPFQPASLLKKKILVVDNVEVTRKISRSLLRELKFEKIIEAVDGVNALENLDKGNVDVIISEWNLSKISGLDLLKKVRSIPKLKSMPFILITSESDKDKIVQAVKAGASQCIVRPFTANMLYEKIKVVFSGERLQ